MDLSGYDDGREVVGGNMVEVSVGGSHTGVPELARDDVDGDSLSGELRSEAVAQGVWVDSFADVCPDCSMAECAAYVRLVERIAYRTFGDSAEEWMALLGWGRPACAPEEFDEDERVIVDPSEALLEALARAYVDEIR